MAHRWRTFALAAAVLTGAVAPVAAGAPATAAPPARVVLYGDSLPWEAQSHFRWPVAAAGVAVRTVTYGGSALCDWAPRALDDADDTDVAVISVSGNATSPCMRPAGLQPSPDVIVQRTLAEAEELTVLLARSGTRVVWVGPPAVGTGVDVPRRLAAGFAAIPTRHANAAYVDAGNAVAPGGRFARTLPCLAFEGPEQGCAGGRIRVRSDDLVHFCPGDAPATEPVVDGCAGWSSGAARFGWAMAAAALSTVGD